MASSRFAIGQNNGRIVPGKPWHVYDLVRGQVALLDNPDPSESAHLGSCTCGCRSHGPLAYFASQAQAQQWVTSQSLASTANREG